MLVVQAYTFNPAGSSDDDYAIWVNPDPTTLGTDTPPPASATAYPEGNDLAYIDRINFRQSTAVQTPQAVTFDEIRVGLSWADVTPVAGPARPEIISVEGAGTTTVTVTWKNTLIGVNYVLQYTTSLSSPQWTDLAAVAGTGGTASQTDNPPSGDTERYYRVRVMTQ